MSDEYINKNNLLNIIHSNVAEKHNERCAQLLEAIIHAPAEDVVPRVEFEALADVARENIDSANERAERMRLESENLRVLYENARINVAKEIITIIERRMKANIERMNGLKSNVWKVGYLTKKRSVPRYQRNY